MQATLVHPRQRSQSASVVSTTIASQGDEVSVLDSGVPTPFPLDAFRSIQQRQKMQRQRSSHSSLASTTSVIPEAAVESETALEPLATFESNEATQTGASNLPLTDVESAAIDERQVLSSLQYLQQSCITTLNDLFSQQASATQQNHPSLAPPNPLPLGDIHPASNLGQTRSGWIEIVPSRRHSMPSPTLVPTSTPATFTVLPPASYARTSSALRTLLSNLRSRASSLNPVQAEAPLIQLDDNEKLETPTQELVRLVATLKDAAFLTNRQDQDLADALVALLSNIESVGQLSTAPDLRTFTSASANPPLHPQPQDPFADTAEAPPSPTLESNVFETLTRRVESVQLKRMDSQTYEDDTKEEGKSTSSVNETQQTEKEKLWEKIDSGLESVLEMCRDRAQQMSRERHIMINGNRPGHIEYPDLLPPPSLSDRQSIDHLPPEYDPADYEFHEADLNKPPEYDTFRDPYDLRNTRPKIDTHNPSTTTYLDATSEKMRLDLESVASAIDRLYLVAPQLSNQRVELKKSKLKEMESARKQGAHTSASSSRVRIKEDYLEDEGSIATLVGRGRMVDQLANPPKSKSSSLSSTSSLSRSMKRLSGSDLKGKGKSRDLASFEDERVKRDELDRMVDLIGKSSSDKRRIDNQRVEFADLQTRIKVREERMLDQLLKHSGTGRLSSQDAILSANSVLNRQYQRSDEAMLSLSEFIQEALPPASSARTLNPDAMLTLPEFFKESRRASSPWITREPASSSAPMTTTHSRTSGGSLFEAMDQMDSDTTVKRPKTLTSKTSIGSLRGSLHLASASPSQLLQTTVSRIKTKSRTRSNSAPPLNLSWLKNMAGGTQYMPVEDQTTELLDDFDDLDQKASLRTHTPHLKIHYIAEYQENLRTVHVFLQVQNAPGLNVQAEVLMGKDMSVSGSDQLQLQVGDNISNPIPLPVLVVPGRQEVKVSGDHLQLKLVTPPMSPPGGYPSPRRLHLPSLISAATTYADEPTTMLDAAQLTSMSPTSFICASCSLPLIHPPKDLLYVDLPSDYWAELLDAWMCHSDQKLSDSVSKIADEGFWPSQEKALVGGSYVLFDEDVVVSGSLKRTSDEKVAGENNPVKCLCGAQIGRSQARHGSEALSYRLAKYAIRPVSPTADPVRLSLSSFLVADMIALQLAHATHRFIIRDDEEDKPRILIWLFNPSIRVSYASTTPYAFIPQENTLHAAKVLFKIISPSATGLSSFRGIIQQYPSFTASEGLSYPLDICRRFGAFLRESNETYPLGRREMSQMDVGWLHRQ